MDRGDVVDQLSAYIDRELLNSATPQVAPTTPLLEYGVLNSLALQQLIVFIRDHLATPVPPDQIVGANFKTLDAVADMVMRLAATPVAVGEPRP